MNIEKLLSEEFVPRKISVENIFLDPNNPRFLEIGELGEIVEDIRIPEDSVQQECLRKLKEYFDVNSLKKSIKENGFLPTDRIAVRPLVGVKGKYVVVEGNRRLAAVKIILKEYESGLPISTKLVESLKELDCLVYIGKDKEISWIIQGIRHLSGIKEWSPYAQGIFIQKLVEERKVPTKELAHKSGMKPAEIAKRLRTIKAFKQAKEDEEYGELITPKDFSMFEEILNRPKLRKWLEWDNDNLKFQNEENLRKLLSWTHPIEGEPQIKWDIHIRDLSKLLDYPDIFSRFEEGEITFEQACNEMKEIEMRKRITKKLKDHLNDVERAIKEIKKLPTVEIRENSEMRKKFVKKLKELKRLIEEQLKLLGK